MNPIDLSGKSAVVTGAARGIGLAVAQRILDSGGSCCLWDVEEKGLAHAREKLAWADRVHTSVVDVTDESAIQAGVSAAVQRFGKIDILVNNAGIAGVSGKVWELTRDQWRAVIEVNLNGVFQCCRAVVPEMMKANYGRVVNIASIAGKEGNPLASHYSAAKAGVIALTKSLGKELAKTGIRVNCITPAVIETEILKQVSREHIDYMLSRIPMGRPGQVQEVAALVAWLASDQCSFSTGAVFDISGGRATY